MMPVRSSDWDFDAIFGLQEHPLLQMEQSLGTDFFSLLPSEDIWKKFDINDVPMPDFRASDMYITDDDVDLDVSMCDQRVPGVTKEAREIRHHDCMWAGRCSSKDHRAVEKDPAKVVVPAVAVATATSVRPTARKTVRNIKSQPEGVVVVTSHVNPACVTTTNANRTARPNVTVLKSASILKSNTVNAKAATAPVGRSLLRTPVKTAPSYALESDGDSPRPDTPSSESEDDDCADFDFKHNLDLSSSVAAVCSEEVLGYDAYRTQVDAESSDDCDNDGFDCVLPNPTTAVAVSEVTGQNLKKPIVVKQTVLSKGDYYNSDHCYHLNKTMHLDSLGVQTPSDSEEEIDVVSFCDSEAQAASRSSSCGGNSLPTNPSDHDKQQLQLAVKSAMTKKQQTTDTVASVRISLQAKVVVDVRRAAEPTKPAKEKTRKKRAATSSDEDRTIFKKGVKRMKRQYHHRLQHHKFNATIRNKKGGSTGSASPRSGSGSSDSEPESLERRSMHNNMERQRRIDLRNLVEGLRILVPSVETKCRAAKVVILKEASIYCQDLTEEYEEKTAEAAALRLKQYKLRQKLSQLRRACANLR